LRDSILVLEEGDLDAVNEVGESVSEDFVTVVDKALADVTEEELRTARAE